MALLPVSSLAQGIVTGGTAALTRALTANNAEVMRHAATFAQTIADLNARVGALEAFNSVVQNGALAAGTLAIALASSTPPKKTEEDEKADTSEAVVKKKPSPLPSTAILSKL